MDISKLSTVSEDEGVVVHLKDAAGHPMYDGDAPVTMRSAGTYSKRYRAAQRAVTKNVFRSARRGEEVEDSQAEENQFALEAACIIEWCFTSGGKPLPITPENWRALAEKQPQWQEQHRAAMGDHERFFRAS